MASTSVHLPAAVVAQLDRVAAERGTSRNRVILQACQALLAEQQGDWPPGFFERSIDPEAVAELQAGGREMEGAILTSRRDRVVPPL